MQQCLPATVSDLADLAESIAASRYERSASQLHLMRWCCSLLRSRFATVPAGVFGPNKLRELQREMVGRKLCRGEVNRRVGVVRRVFKTGVAHELVPVTVLQALKALEPLRRGWTEAHDMEPVLPVPEGDWKRTLEHLSPTVQAMVRLQACTGMRTQDLVRMKVGELDRSRAPWIYRPGEHKNTWRGWKRALPLGPRAREVLAAALEGLAATDFVFSPRRELARLSAERRSKRKTPLWKSHLRNRRAAAPKRAPAASYNVQSYARAVLRACLRGSVPRWRPYQLRHAHLTQVRAVHGLDGAQVIAGHRHARTAEIYARLNEERAAVIAEELG